MNEPKPFASLSPTLLARKGAARPAMRTPFQPLGMFERFDTFPVEDDLGWNDMGHEHSGAESAAPAPTLQPAPRQSALIRQAAGNRAAERRKALEEGRRAAFTLRVDAERHLKLRLACTIRNLSAQQIVTEALDRLLSGMPDLDTLAAQVKRK
ncbi:MAG: hypothetical protein BGO57_11880 [Sphingomonadales bacterium 63-6]|nr:MAG: hypothetical protein BGO57_11880 [Sphingomonadales bacterium 63-6]